MDKPYLYLYENNRPIIFTILANLILAFSIITLLNTPFFSLILGIGTSGFLLRKCGIELSFTVNKYRYITSYGPQLFGEWLPLPELNYVSVFKQKMSGKLYGQSGNAINQEFYLIEVKLVTKSNQTHVVLVSREVEEALNFAHQLSEKLGIRIWDATELEGKFIN